MNRSSRILTILALVVLLTSACQPVRKFAASPSPPTAAAAALDEATVTKFDEYVTKHQASNNVPGLAVGIVKDGQLVYTKELGVANVDTGEPVTAETVFRLADIDAIPTAIAILQLAEQGKIDLDEPVTTYLPYFQLRDERYKDITVRHILEGRSGLHDAGDNAENWATYPSVTDEGAVERFVRGMAEDSLLFTSQLAFAPGEGFERSYLAYIVLGDVIQKVSGQSYEEYVSENIFAPLGMENSTMLLSEVDPALLAAPHIVQEGDFNIKTAKIVVSDLVPYSREFAAADNFYSNLEDMARLLTALLNGGELDGVRILSPESVALLWTPTGPAGDERGLYTGIERSARVHQQFGLGGYMGDIAGCPVYHIFGMQLGYRANVMLCPDENLAVLVMGNRGQNERLHQGIVDERYALNMVPDIMSMLLEDTE